MKFEFGKILMVKNGRGELWFIIFQNRISNSELKKMNFSGEEKNRTGPELLPNHLKIGQNEQLMNR